MTRFGVIFLSVLWLSQVCYSKDEEIGSFWHFTDFHVDTKYEISDTSKLWGSYDRDASGIVAFTGIEIGNDYGYAENKPDFVVWGGDAAPHSAHETAEDLEASLQFLSHHFKFAFKPKEIPFIPLLGNHDVFPSNKMSVKDDDPDRINWCAKLASDEKLWNPWVAKAAESLRDAVGISKSNFSENCYHSLLVEKPSKVLILAVNSLLWYSNNPLVDETNKDPLGQFEWLTNSLDWAQNHGAKVLLTMHVPPGAPEFSPKQYKHLKQEYNDRLVGILRKYSEVIMTTLASHEHVDAFRVILDEKHHPVSTMFIGPSVTPIYLHGIGSTNPRIRQYTYNRKTGQIVDYRQYFLDLSQEGPSWELEYEALKEYKLKSLLPKEMANMLDMFTSKDNSEGLWELYWKHQLGGRPHDKPVGRTDGQCPQAQSKCRCEQICSIRHLDSKSVDDCLKICSKSDKPQLPTIEEMINPPVKPSGGSNTATIVGSVVGVLLVLGIACAVIFMIRKKRRQRQLH